MWFNVFVSQLNISAMVFHFPTTERVVSLACSQFSGLILIFQVETAAVYWFTYWLFHIVVVVLTVQTNHKEQQPKAKWSNASNHTSPCSLKSPFFNTSQRLQLMPDLQTFGACEGKITCQIVICSRCCESVEMHYMLVERRNMSG